jgi:hypothetical protein
MRPRVLFADDHTLVLEGLRKLLENDCEPVGMVEDGLLRTFSIHHCGGLAAAPVKWCRSTSSAGLPRGV